MEPLDPGRNDERFSKRRISSILKGPRKSIRFPDPEQQENKVECAKPVDKRISRRVSFAPADDVLLFSKDIKNASPVRSPLEASITTATQNGALVAVTDIGNQKITGMETLLNAPLHASQYKDKVKFGVREDFGEKTVVFSKDDALMDMTHCHTINIDKDEDLFDVLSTGREKTVMFNVDDGSMDMTQSHTANLAVGTVSLPEKSMSIAALHGFENFLASLSKPSGPGVKAAQRTFEDKENQAPFSVSAVMEKSVNASMKIAQSSNISQKCQKDDVSMDVTKAPTGRGQESTDDDDAFQWLFPTQDMYSQQDNKVSQTAEKIKQRPSGKTLTSISTKEMASSKKPLHASHQRPKVILDIKDESREKNQLMDMTQSHTCNIDSGLLATLPKNLSGKMENNSSVEERKREACVPLNPSANFLSSHSKTNVTSDKENQPLNTTSSFKESFHGHTICPENDVSMEMTEAQTGHIMDLSDIKEPFQFVFPEQDMCPQRASLKKTELTPLQQRSEKTVRFTANDAGMDVTRSHTGNIIHFEQSSIENAAVLPPYGERTVRFTANDAGMDVTRNHTVNIVTNLQPQSHRNADFLPAYGDKTIRFAATDATMDVTQSHTVNIVTDSAHSHQDPNIVTNFQPQSHQNADILPAYGDKTIRFAATDATMDVTQSHTVNIVTDSAHSRQDPKTLTTHENMELSSSKGRGSGNCVARRSLAAHALNPGSKKSLPRMSGTYPVIAQAVAPAAPFLQENVDPNQFLDQLKTQVPDVEAQEKALGLVSTVLEKPLNETQTDCPQEDLSMDMTEAQTGHIWGPTCTEEPPQGHSSTQELYPSSEDLKLTDVITHQSNEALISSNPDGVAVPTHSGTFNSNETDTRKEPEPRNQSPSSSEYMESSPNAFHHVDAAPSRKSRQKSLADLHSKIRRLSQMITSDPDTMAMENCTVPTPHLDHHMDENSDDRTEPQPITEPVLKINFLNTEENVQAQCLAQEEQLPTSTPFNLKTKQLVSRLSVGGFKAKLPQRNKPDDPKKINPVREHTRKIAVDVTNQLSNVDSDVSDIYNEELGSCEDMSEMLDVRSPQKAVEVLNPQEFIMEVSLENNVFQSDIHSPVHGSSLTDGNKLGEERKMQACETAADDETGLHSRECDDNMTAAQSMATQTTDYSNSVHSASMRCEATFESTFKQSLFESQLEDYANDVQRKLDDGTITMLEFFKLFNMDFVIHNPRQSIRPGKLSSDTECTPMDVLKDRHINRPKQMVYETEVQNLTENVEGLKVRMRDLDKPLSIANNTLWEEIRNLSEQELKSFGAKLKERNNLFRKTSKVRSHEMKEGLYSNLVQANLEAQQRLGGSIETADEMIKSLDDCIGELEKELHAVEEKGFEDAPSLKSQLDELQKVTGAVADKNKQISELELQMIQNSNKVNRLKVERSKLESHMDMQHMLNEWKLRETRDNCTLYTFLYETFHLQLVYEKSTGNAADNQPERKVAQITFKHQLDVEKSKGHSCLVHTLLSQFIEEETGWEEKYPTSRHVPKLLHDVSLVVSRCRLLGEELRLLETWGSLRLDILHIRCVDTQVQIVFSSLKAFSKFEVTFSVRLTNRVCVLQLQSLKNIIGSTTIQQVEEIVALFSPGKDLLTKIIKKIHRDLLC